MISLRALSRDSRAAVELYHSPLSSLLSPALSIGRGRPPQKKVQTALSAFQAPDGARRAGGRPPAGPAAVRRHCSHPLLSFYPWLRHDRGKPARSSCGRPPASPSSSLTRRRRAPLRRHDGTGRGAGKGRQAGAMLCGFRRRGAFASSQGLRLRVDNINARTVANQLFDVGRCSSNAPTFSQPSGRIERRRRHRSSCPPCSSPLTMPRHVSCQPQLSTPLRRTLFWFHACSMGAADCTCQFASTHTKRCSGLCAENAMSSPSMHLRQACQLRLQSPEHACLAVTHECGSSTAVNKMFRFVHSRCREFFSAILNTHSCSIPSFGTTSKDAVGSEDSTAWQWSQASVAPCYVGQLSTTCGQRIAAAHCCSISRARADCTKACACIRLDGFPLASLEF
eukprot:363759-Chlamydomonas_euryale.AAC.1